MVNVSDAKVSEKSVGLHGLLAAVQRDYQPTVSSLLEVLLVASCLVAVVRALRVRQQVPVVSRLAMALLLVVIGVTASFGVLRFGGVTAALPFHSSLTKLTKVAVPVLFAVSALYLHRHPSGASAAPVQALAMLLAVPYFTAYQPHQLENLATIATGVFGLYTLKGVALGYARNAAVLMTFIAAAMAAGQWVEKNVRPSAYVATTLAGVDLNHLLLVVAVGSVPAALAAYVKPHLEFPQGAAPPVDSDDEDESEADALRRESKKRR